MRAFYFLPQNIYVNHPAIFDKYFYFFDKYKEKIRECERIGARRF